jgi:hypothetical protein
MLFAKERGEPLSWWMRWKTRQKCVANCGIRRLVQKRAAIDRLTDTDRFAQSLLKYQKSRWAVGERSEQRATDATIESNDEMNEI